MDFTAIKLLILDVDGVLTDGRLLIGPDGERTKTFHVHDGCALKLWHRSGGHSAVLSSRASAALDLRAHELGISLVRAGVPEKVAGYEAILKEGAFIDAQVAYVGDDLPDLPVMARVGLPIAVAQAVPAVKKRATYVTARRGGQGAVAEVVELLLRKQRRWSGPMLTEP